MINGKWIWMSHVLDETTPAYANGNGLQIIPDKQIINGDSCNTSLIKMPCHLGSHVDAPKHFIADGLPIHTYAPEEWIFNFPYIIDVSVVDKSRLLLPACLKSIPQNLIVKNQSIDFLFIKTGFSAYRSKSVYWEKGPGLSLALSRAIVELFPNIKGIGMDFISVSSLKYRDEGRNTHRFLLGKGVRLFEDLTLENLNKNMTLSQIIALPLRVSELDGAPCTVMGLSIGNDNSKYN